MIIEPQNKSCNALGKKDCSKVVIENFSTEQIDGTNYIVKTLY